MEGGRFAYTRCLLMMRVLVLTIPVNSPTSFQWKALRCCSTTAAKWKSPLKWADHLQVTECFEPEHENPADMQRMGWQAILDNFKSTWRRWIDVIVIFQVECSINTQHSLNPLLTELILWSFVYIVSLLFHLKLLIHKVLDRELKYEYHWSFCRHNLLPSWGKYLNTIYCSEFWWNLNWEIVKSRIWKYFITLSPAIMSLDAVCNIDSSANVCQKTEIVSNPLMYL